MFRGLDLLLEFGRLVRFGVVGIIALVIYASTTLLAVEILGLGSVQASIFGHVMAMVISYVGHSAFSFGVKIDHGGYAWRFLTVAVLMFCFNGFVTWSITDLLQAPLQVSVVVVMVLIPLANYFFNRFWVFSGGLAPSAGISKQRETHRACSET